MYARVTAVSVAPEAIDGGIENFKKDVAGVAQSSDGYRAALLFVDRDGGKAIGMTLWDSEEARTQGGERLTEARNRTLEAMGIDPAAAGDPDLYEVAYSDFR